MLWHFSNNFTFMPVRHTSIFLKFFMPVSEIVVWDDLKRSRYGNVYRFTG